MRDFLTLICLFCCAMTIAFIIKKLNEKKPPKKHTPKYDLPFKSLVRNKKPPKH